MQASIVRLELHASATFSPRWRFGSSDREALRALRRRTIKDRPNVQDTETGGERFTGCAGVLHSQLSGHWLVRDL
jgi:hypothetical protein